MKFLFFFLLFLVLFRTKHFPSNAQILWGEGNEFLHSVAAPDIGGNATEFKDVSLAKANEFRHDVIRERNNHTRAPAQGRWSDSVFLLNRFLLIHSYEAAA